MRLFYIFLFAAIGFLFSVNSRSLFRELGAWVLHDSSILTETDAGAWRDTQTRVQFNLTEGWKIRTARRWGKGETTVRFEDAAAASTNAALYYRVAHEATLRTPEETEKSLLEELKYKVAQRRRQGLPDYRARPHSRHLVAGQPAISWVADFSLAGQPMVEVCTLIQSEHSTALFFTKLPQEGLKEFQERFAPVVASLRIP